MAYPPEVERWRPLVEKYFPPELVDKALYVIQYESGGRPIMQIGGGPGTGLFQIEHGGAHPGRLSAQELLDPETNVRVAAQMASKNWGQWTDWGEGVTYQGKKFGALGNHPYPSNTSGRGFQAPPPPGGTMATPQQEDVAQKYFGMSYTDLRGEEQAFIDTKVRSLYGVEGLTGPQPSAAQASKPDGFIEYDDAGNAYKYMGGKATLDPTAPPKPNSAVNPAPVVIQTQPVSTAASMSEEQIRQSVEAQGGRLAERGGVFIASWPDGSTTTYDPTGFPRDGKTTYNPTYKAAPAASTSAAPKKSVAQLAYENLGNVGGNKPAEEAASTAAPQAQGAPVPQGGNQFGDPASRDYKVTGNPMIGQDVYAPADIFGNKGSVAGSWVPTPGGGSMFLTPQNAQAMAAASYGTDPSGDPMKDLMGGAAAMADRALMSAQNPGMSPAQIQSRFFDVPGGFDRQREALANAALTQAGGLLKPPQEEEPGMSYPFGPIKGFAEGGSLTINPDEEGPVPGTARDKPRINSQGMVTREYPGGKYEMPMSGGGYRLQGGTNVSGLMDAYKAGPWGGWKNFGPESNLDEIYQHYFPIWLAGQDRRFRDIPGGGAWDWSDYNAPRLSVGGKMYQFANGGGMMLDEPVVGMGMQSGQPKFLAGEAGPERLDFTPQPGAAPMPGGGMGMQSMAPPMPQGNTDPRLLALFAQTAAQRMRPRSVV